ncbi:hypothetical protein CLOSTHATH_01672 [Hungatella hathewayi DSM 13479]|uniref:Uncharacterized protein n=1 Tax=Hungatella hathewayi DSM 13479 TaxID=566550 RepID=D3ADJ4_9FIRM|nr:hypothetical protein CLOSTHATH_01672 [Hungatella hathewayi DSM 13479]
MLCGSFYRCFSSFPDSLSVSLHLTIPAFFVILLYIYITV